MIVPGDAGYDSKDFEKIKINPCDNCNMKYASEGDCHTTCKEFKEWEKKEGK